MVLLIQRNRLHQTLIQMVHLASILNPLMISQTMLNTKALPPLNKEEIYEVAEQKDAK